MRTRLSTVTAAGFLLIMLANPSVQAGCNQDIINDYNCSTNDAINCGIQKTHEFRLFLEGTPTPTVQQVNDELADLLVLAERAAACRPNFKGWAWTNVLLATSEVMLKGLSDLSGSRSDHRNDRRQRPRYDQLLPVPHGRALAGHESRRACR